MRFQRQSLWVLVGLLALVTASCGWPMYQFGPSHQGYNPLEHKVGVANVASLTTEWTDPVTSGYSPGPPAVSRGVVYVDSGEKLFAFNAGSTGCSGSPKVCSPLWSASTGVGPQPSAPAVAYGTVYVGSDVGKLYAFDANGSTGCSGTPKVCSPLWTATLNVEDDSTGYPTVDNGMVFIGTESGTLYAFDAAGTTNCSGTPRTCNPLWTATTQSGFLAPPTVSGGVVYVGTGIPIHFGTTTGSGEFYAFDENTGALLWTFRTHELFWSTAAVAHGVVYVPLTADTGSAIGELAAFDAAGTTGCSGTPKTCNPVWTAPTPAGRNLSDPAVANGVVYVGTGEGDLYAFDAHGTTGCSGTPTTCTPLWTAVTNRAISTPTIANGVVYVGAGGGEALAFDAAGSTACSGTPKTCNPLWTFTNNSDGVSPVVANGVVYVGVANELDALSTP